MEKTKGALIRHPEFSFLYGGRPTENGRSEFCKRIFKFIDPKQRTIVIATTDPWTQIPIPRTKIPAEDLMGKLSAGRLIFSPMFGPLTTKQYPPIFNGRFFETLKNSKSINQLTLTAWGAGFPLFTESPAQVNHRVKIGIRELQNLANSSEQIVIIGHQELFPFFEMFFEGKTFAQALSQVIRRSILHLDTYCFDL